MTIKEMNLRVFRREPIPHVFFQPRFEPWFAWHRQLSLCRRASRQKAQGRAIS